MKSNPFFLFIILFFIIFFSACSSAPKRPVEVRADRDMALSQLNLANQSANRGRFEEALGLLEEARRLAVSTDDPALRIKTTISRGDFLFSLGRYTEAFREWESAASEADSKQAVLASLARIHSIRGQLIYSELGLSEESLNENENNEGKKITLSSVDELRAQLGKEMAAVSSDALSNATAYVTLGLTEKQAQRWAEAETAIKRALDIHEKNVYLEDAAYDWFLIASVRSVAGNYDAAIEALRTAINFDRRAENGYGLASSWQAMGEVYLKAGRAEESRAALSRAAEIYRAIGLNDKAEAITGKL